MLAQRSWFVLPSWVGFDWRGASARFIIWQSEARLSRPLGFCCMLEDFIWVKFLKGEQPVKPKQFLIILFERTCIVHESTYRRHNLLASKSTPQICCISSIFWYPVCHFFSSALPFAKSNIIGVFPKCQDTGAVSQFGGWILCGPHF